MELLYLNVHFQTPTRSLSFERLDTYHKYSVNVDCAFAEAKPSKVAAGGSD